MFVAEGRKLRQVLGGLSISQARGEWDGNCAGNFSQTERTIRIGTTRSKGFADLIVTSITTGSENKMINGECESVEQKPQVSNATLHYDGKTYVLPPELAGL